MGTSYFAVPILKSLYQNGYPISVVYTQPPKKSNRGQKLNKSPINLFSENISLDVRTPQTLKNNNEEELYLSELQPDLVVVVSYGQIIPKTLLNIPKNGFLRLILFFTLKLSMADGLTFCPLFDFCGGCV